MVTGTDPEEIEMPGTPLEEGSLDEALGDWEDQEREEYGRELENIENAERWPLRC